MIGIFIAAVGLIALLAIHFLIRDRIKYDIGWILHFSGGMFLATLWLSEFHGSSMMSLLIFVGAVAVSWEILELFYRAGKILTWHRCLDILLPLLGAAAYNLLTELF